MRFVEMSLIVDDHRCSMGVYRRLPMLIVFIEIMCSSFHTPNRSRKEDYWGCGAMQML